VPHPSFLRCIFEIYATLFHAGDRFGKLQVRAGTVDGSGRFEPCNDQGQLCELATGIDASKAGATVASDKSMILARLKNLGAAERNGVAELNRKLSRAVRHGWT